MELERALLEEARYAAKRIASEAKALESELLEIEQRKLEIQRKLEAAARASNRLAEFSPKTGTKYQCPRCWVRNERTSPLSPVPSSTDDDIMRCHTCGADFLIPNG